MTGCAAFAPLLRGRLGGKSGSKRDIGVCKIQGAGVGFSPPGSKSKGWASIAPWCEGSPPEPYNLFKLKDLLKTCSEVFADKGKCCRQRPISPNTKHWLRRVYKKAGSVLRLLCLSIPAGSITFLSTTKLSEYIQEWMGCEEGWMLYTGDISSCYDELQHHLCLDGLRWALASMPTWTGRRHCNRYWVHKRCRKQVQCTPAHTDDWQSLSQDEVMSVCDFDVQNSVLLVRKKLYRRKLGCPMGGFLSAFYTILCFAFIEHKCVGPMFMKLGLQGLIKRYLDDVLLIVRARTTAERTKVLTYVDWLGREPYPPPLQLNLEPEGPQDFLEASVRMMDGQVSCMINNQVMADMAKGMPPYRQRLPHPGTVSRTELRDLVLGIGVRAVQYASGPVQVETSLLLLKLEVLLTGHPCSVFTEVARILSHRYRSNEKVIEGLIHKHLWG